MNLTEQPTEKEISNAQALFNVKAVDFTSPVSYQRGTIYLKCLQFDMDDLVEGQHETLKLLDEYIKQAVSAEELREMVDNLMKEKEVASKHLYS